MTKNKRSCRTKISSYSGLGQNYQAYQDQRPGGIINRGVGQHVSNTYTGEHISDTFTGQHISNAYTGQYNMVDPIRTNTQDSQQDLQPQKEDNLKKKTTSK